MPETAIDHAQAAGDADTVARLVLQICNPVWASGRNDTVRRWMEWFEANDLIERHPGIAVCGALQFAVDGRPAATERWADAAEATSHDRSARRREHDRGHVGLPAGEPVPQRARRRCDATPRSPCMDSARPVRFAANMIQVEGLSHLLEGDADRADAFFARAVDEATRLQHATVRRPPARRPRQRGDRTG